MTRVAMVGSALSQLGNVITAFDLKETGPNESFSARMHRQKRSREKLINALFFWQRNPGHCERSFLADVFDAQALLEEAKTEALFAAPHQTEPNNED